MALWGIIGCKVGRFSKIEEGWSEVLCYFNSRHYFEYAKIFEINISQGFEGWSIDFDKD